MGQMHQAPGGPADAGRALPGYRYTLIPCGDAARPSDPYRLRAWRRCALRLPCARHRCADTCCAPRRGLQTACMDSPRLRRREGGVAQPFGSPPGERRAAPWCRKRISVADRLPLCPSEPPIAAQSLAGGGLRPASLRDACKAPRQRASRDHILAPSGLRYPSRLGLRLPRCHVPLLQPETPPAPFGALPARRFVRRLRRAEPSERRTGMTTKTTSTTNDAGVPPAPPEAHQRAGKVTCHGCRYLEDIGDEAVGWCRMHHQYRHITTPRTCEWAEFN